MNEHNKGDNIEDGSLLTPPTAVRGMKSLDRERFTKQIVVPTLQIGVNIIKLVWKKKFLHKYLMKLANFKSVQHLEVNAPKDNMDSISIDSNNLMMVIYLNPLLISSYHDFKEEEKITLASMGITDEAFKCVDFTISYQNWKVDQILNAILPQFKVTSFQTIGHIISLNLPKGAMEYKQIIGQVLVDKIPGAKTIINRKGGINSFSSALQMEVICGEHDFVVRVQENHCTYEFDYSAVYWNGRLNTEHERITKNLNRGDVLYDVFAGVGPFSIPASKKKCIVLANDLNPVSYKWLKHNGKLNKVLQFLKLFNKDGGDFIRDDVKTDMLQRWKSENQKNKFMHITMNLPARAVTLLSIFNGLFYEEELKGLNIKNFPIVHVYCHTKGCKGSYKLALQNVESNLGSKLNKQDINKITFVQSLAPTKHIICVSFTLSPDILLGRHFETEGQSLELCSGSPPPKRLCLHKHDVTGLNYEEAKSKEFTEQAKNQQEQGINVFKVAEYRSLKIKNKANSVENQLKKVNEVNQMKTAEVDARLENLQENLLQKPQPATTDDSKEEK